MIFCVRGFPRPPLVYHSPGLEVNCVMLVSPLIYLDFPLTCQEHNTVYAAVLQFIQRFVEAFHSHDSP